jgi:ABC-type proline/glycine betaine transport system permease subunit
VLTLVAVWLSNTQVWANQFPTSPDLGAPISDAVDRVTDWLRSDLSELTTSIQEAFTNLFLNPVQGLVASSPWYVTGAALLAVAAHRRWRTRVRATAICLTGIYFLDLWNNAMITLTSVVTATAVVMFVGVMLGVWMGRSKAADRGIRPLLDAAQTIPPFVYLVPILILFGPNRFTAILAGVIYAVPPATKLIADGIRGVAPATIEAAESAGIDVVADDHQGAAADGALVAAARNEPGLLYVLSMVVIGGMVGAGALGGDIVTGFRQTSMVGRGSPRASPSSCWDHARPHHHTWSAAIGTGRCPRRTTAYPPRPNWRTHMTRHTRALLGCVSLAAVVALTGCGSEIEDNDAAAASEDCGTVDMAINPWVGYESNAHVVGRIAETELGCTVNYKDLDEQTAWKGFDDGTVDVIIENWGHPELVEKYIDGAGTAQDAGSTGVKGSSAGTSRRGWPRSTRTSPAGRTSTSTPTCSRLPSPTARASCSTATPATSPTTRPWSRTSTSTSRWSSAAARPR